MAVFEARVWVGLSKAGFVGNAEACPSRFVVLVVHAPSFRTGGGPRDEVSFGTCSLHLGRSTTGITRGAAVSPGGAPRCGTVQHDTVPCSAVQQSTIWYSIPYPNPGENMVSAVLFTVLLCSTNICASGKNATLLAFRAHLQLVQQEDLPSFLNSKNSVSQRSTWLR